MLPCKCLVYIRLPMDGKRLHEPHSKMESHALLHDFDLVEEFTSEQIIEFLRVESLISDEPLTSYFQAENHDHELVFKNGTGLLCGEGEGMVPAMTTPEIVMEGDRFNFHGGPDLDIGGKEEEIDEREEIEGDDSSETTNVVGAVRKSTSDRSRTLVAERKRRGCMKEKLYALRALVPNITKMDKASIVGDAVTYVQDLQRHAKKLRAEMEGLESSKTGNHSTFKATFEKDDQKAKFNARDHYKKPNILMKILQMEVFQVEGTGFYVRVVCGKGNGVAVTLYKALESLSCFKVQSSNFSTLPERLVLTLTLNVINSVEEINSSTMKIWLMSAFLNQGFEFQVQNA